MDVGNLLINELVGSVWLFIIIVLLIISYFSIKYNFDNKTMASLFIVASLGITGYYFQQEIIVVIALVVGFVVYLIWSKLISR